MQEVDFLITTMDRYHCLSRLLYSIFRFYPKAKVIVADQSKIIASNFYNKWSGRDLKVLPLPYDCGLSRARNLLVENSYRKYKLILEDDFIFTEDTCIEKLMVLTDKGDIVGGAVYNQGVKINFNHYFEKIGGTIYQIPDGDNWEKYMGINYKKTGCVLNFFLAKSNVFNRYRWNEKLKLREHQHFFYRVKKPIVYTEDVKINHNNTGNHHWYKSLKGRDHFWKIALEDLGATKIKYLTGQCVEIENNKIVRYKEKYDICRKKIKD